MDIAAGDLSNAARPMPVAEVLAIGEQLAHALAALHARGERHLGVRPQVIRWRDGRAMLAEPPGGAPPPGADVQRLAYIAPEQTGRLERPVDARSDLYALGVVLYELLTGARPFEAADALAQIHGHIAGLAPAPSERNPAVPAPLSSIVMRLLEKSPDERYQSAQGLANDLARCAADWSAHRRIEPFELGGRDPAPGLAAGSRRVGRERELAALQAAFERACAGTRSLVLVTGYAGIGKTTLIRELYRPIASRRGYFVSGKFDQVVRGVPFGALIQALRGLVRQWLGESEAGLAHWRERLGAALGANAGVLTQVIPEIEFIVGPQPVPVELGATEAQNRFQRVLQRFFAALATPEHPLVLFLDDLQWADAATLALLEPLVTDPDGGCLLLLGAFRDPELADSPRLERALASLQAAGAALERIELGPLAHDEFVHLVAGALGTTPADAAPLAARVHAKTGGNPFFAMQFLRLLEREGRLRRDAASARWTCDLEALEHTPLAENVVDLMTRRLRRLAPPVQYLLTLAACIGNRFDLATLAVVSEQSAAAAAAELAPALAEGLVVREGAADGGRYAFLHDRVQQSAYALIPAPRRQMVHLTVGRLLRRRAGGAGDGSLFDLVHHLNQGRSLITDSGERHEVAALDLAAGRRAKSATAHEAALDLFGAGLELLGADGARQDRRLAFELALERAECRCLCGQSDAALAEVGRLVEQAASALDRARAIRQRCVQYENLGRYADSLASARAGLALFDVTLPEGEAACAAGLDDELAAIERLRAGRPIEALAELPTMTDEATRIVMAMLTDIWSAAYLVGAPTLSRLISAMLVRLSLQHGNVEESAYGYVTHAITIGAQMADYRAADAYGRLALAVNRRFDDRRRRAKIYQQFQAHVNFWCQPVRSGIALAREACAAGLDSGDFPYAAYAAGTEPWAAMASTQDLAAFEREYTPSVGFIERLKNAAFADSVRMLLAWARALQGRTQDPLSLSGAGFDEDAWCARYGGQRFFASVHAVARLQIAVLLGDADTARQAAQHSQALIDAVPGTLWPVLHDFWHPMALARAADSDDAAARAALAAARDLFESRARHNAENHRAQALLLAAELARLERREADAQAAAEQAAEFTATAPLRPLQALAHELLARTHDRAQRPQLAAMHFARASDLYAAWGAQAKVAALEREQPAIARAPARGTGSAAPAPAAADELDLGSVLKATQAIAGEVEKERLVARLLHIVIENAGAERGALVLEGDPGPTVHAVAPGAAAPERQPLEGCTGLPQTLVNRVRRTGETLLLADTPDDDALADDPYLQRHRPRALACLPMRHQGRAVGVLYVEHRRAGGVFTAARLATLQALATQAAISLQNAALVGGLKQALAEVERLRDELEAENSALRRDLIANVSHDLRVPLVSMRGYLELLVRRGDAVAAAQRSEFLAVALRQSERLATLIDELFELAKLDFKGLRLAREPFAFGELAADVVQKFRLVAESRQVQLRVEVAPALPFVHADLGLVERVLDNLIGNALQHTPPGGRVTVRGQAAGAEVEVGVDDDGCGIDAADLPHVFDRFYRGRGGRRGDGAGLGLAIARRIVELHGSTLQVTSEPGRGTRFGFRLPATVAGPQAG